MQFKNYLHLIYSWLLPYTCILCNLPAAPRTQDLCQPCLNEMPILLHSCPRCANILPLVPHQNLRCGQCIKSPPPFNATYALGAYQPPITKLITELKFHEGLVNARILGELMTEAIQRTWYYKKPLPTLLIPIPLHPKRLQERGFNQAIEIARPIVKTLRLPLDYTSCHRIKHTAAQTTMPAQQRKKNVVNAFHINRDLTGLHIAILDDVITTGHTITAFCKSLKQAGAKTIDVWCCAKTLL